MMSRKVLKEENGSPDFLSGNVVGCFFWKITLIIMFKFFNILKASIWQGVGPADWVTCLACLGHWQRGEGRRSILLKVLTWQQNKQPLWPEWSQDGVENFAPMPNQCNLDIIAPFWPATMPGPLWRRPTYTGLLPKDIDAMWGQIFTGLPLIGVWCGRRKMESGWQGSRGGLARRYWMAWDWI